MNPNDPNVAMLEVVAEALGGELREEMVFVGGAAAGLLITDPAMPAIRPTEDVDLIFQAVALIEYRRFEERLRARGFARDHTPNPVRKHWRGPCASLCIGTSTFPRAALVALLLLNATAHAQVYRCELNGKLAFSDQPCKPGAKGTQKDYAPPTAASGTLDLQVPVAYYTVQGRDYETLAQSLQANGPKGFHGLASWKLRYDYTTKKQRDGCRIDTVKVKVDGEILMPKWVDEQAAPPDLQNRWRTYSEALKRHEDGHVQHGRELALLVKERMMGLGTVPCEGMKALTEGEVGRLYANLKKRDEEYDARTQHGATQGARF